MAKSDKDTAAREGWIVRRMAQLERKSRSWPVWMHEVKVRPEPPTRSPRESRSAKQDSDETASTNEG